MDLGTICTKLKKGNYASVDAFCADVNLVWNNCYTYNPLASEISEMARRLQKIFEAEVAETKGKTATAAPTKKKKAIRDSIIVNGESSSCIMQCGNSIRLAKRRLAQRQAGGRSQRQ